MSRRIRLILGLGVALLIGISCQDTPTDPDATEARPEFTASSAPLSFYHVSAGLIHTCGITTEHRAYCWGLNRDDLDGRTGQLGDGTTKDHDRPVAVAGGLSFRQISVGDFHTCAVTMEYKAYCWGYNAGGQLGDGTNTRRLTPKAVSGSHRFRQVTAGRWATCGVSYPDNRGYCWGNNGALGDGTTMARLTPTQVSGNLRFRQLSTSSTHTCGVTSDYRAYCWGGGGEGQLGNGTRSTKLIPTPVNGGYQFSETDVGSRSTCAITTTNRAYCWGANWMGQVGDGSTVQRRLAPRAVVGGLEFKSVNVGEGTSCGVTLDNRAYCWGYNDAGNVGDGTTVDRNTPTPLVGTYRFMQVTVGLHTCARNMARKAYCWGDNSYDLLGTGQPGTYVTFPAPVLAP